LCSDAPTPSNVFIPTPSSCQFISGVLDGVGFPAKRLMTRDSGMLQAVAHFFG